jgi:hypothetical protein
MGLRDWLAGASGAGQARVLFLGNSLTYHARGGRVLNDVPGLWQALCRARGRSAVAATLAEDSATLEDHEAGSALAEQLRPGRWTAVVLQQRSGSAGRAPEAAATLARLKARAEAAGARPLVLTTWSRERGESPVPAEQAARDAGIAVIPAARAWHEVELTHPALRLRSGDGLHPGPLGSYLAALCCLEALEPGTEATAQQALAADLEEVAALAAAHGTRPPKADELRVLRQAARAARLR